MDSIERKALATNALSAKVIRDAYSAAPDMTREKLIEVVRWIAVSHERLRAELQGCETLMESMNATLGKVRMAVGGNADYDDVDFNAPWLPCGLMVEIESVMLKEHRE